MFNFWQTMSTDFAVEMNKLVKGEYNDKYGPYPESFPLLMDVSVYTTNLYRYIVGEDAVDTGFKRWQAAGRTYKMWSLNANKPEGYQQIRDDFDMLNLAYNKDFDIVGAWRFDDGRPVGMQWVDPEDHSQGLTGTPWYPTPAQVINFMPDVDGQPATELTDVHLLYGQAPRVFVME